jgi:hypothetical protein
MQHLHGIANKFMGNALQDKELRRHFTQHVCCCNFPYGCCASILITKNKNNEIAVIIIIVIASIVAVISFQHYTEFL